MKIAHLAHFGPRAFKIINQGLIQSELNFETSRLDVSFGRLIKKPSLEVINSLNSFDIIFAGDVVYNNLIEEKKCWHKVIWYDFEDDLSANEEALDKSSVYFKRSLVDHKRIFKKFKKHVFPIDYCLMDEYIIPKIEKNIEVCCPYDIKIKDFRRSTVVEKILQANISNSFVGLINQDGSEGRNYLQKKNPTKYVDYLSILARSKIIFCAFPQNHDGDSRNWEAFGSRSLVFRDKTWINMPHPLQNNLHFVEFDASEIESVSHAIEKAKYFLHCEKDREKISNFGFQCALNFHRAKNRVQYMIQIFKQKNFL